MDPFLSHAITYALYEIGDLKSLPEKHPLAKQVLLMRKADERSIRSDAYPKSFLKWKTYQESWPSRSNVSMRCRPICQRRRRAWGKAVQ